MEKGKTFALISDAGTPLISDPGSLLVKEMIRQDFPFTFVPGPSALIAALILSGFPSDDFLFRGFLPTASEKRKIAIANLVAFPEQTIVLFESPQRIVGLLRELGEILGDREIAVCRELTKLHEEVLRGTIAHLLPQLANRKLQGEFTLVIGPGEAPRIEMSDDSIRNRFQQLQQEGFSRKDALKRLSRESGRSKNELYELLMK